MLTLLLMGLTIGFAIGIGFATVISMVVFFRPKDDDKEFFKDARTEQITVLGQINATLRDINANLPK